LIFSGHTAAGVLLGYFTLQNPRLPGVVRLGVGVLMLSHGLVNVMVGDHYTRDVLLATVIAWLLGSQYQRLMRRLSTGVTE
jgi:membrane-associated phospholipid phosphatase